MTYIINADVVNKGLLYPLLINGIYDFAFVGVNPNATT
jgi:hypothetical protein